MALKVKSIHSPIDRRNDGLRIFAARFPPRGISASRYDVWMPSLGPTEKTLFAFLDKTLPWAKFSKIYNAEMFMDGPVDSLSKNVKNHGQKFTLRLIKQLAKKGNVTLMCVCPEDRKECHRHLLRKLILSKQI